MNAHSRPLPPNTDAVEWFVRKFKTTIISGVPQGPNGKTKKAIDKIIEEILNNLTPWLALTDPEFENRTDENPPRIIHNLNLVFTDNSIVQSNQWTKRLADENKIVVWNLGSCKDAHHSNISSVIHKVFHAKKVDELPNVIVMCTHQKRFDDILELVEYIGMNHHGNRNFKFKLNCFFDEPDVNTNASKIFKFLDRLQELDIERSDYIVNELAFITATYMDAFATTLRKEYIDVDQCRTLYSCSHLGEYRSVLMNDCKKIDEKYDTMNSVEAAKTLMDEEGIANEPGKKIIFAPADVKVETHTHMREMFQGEYGYDILVINSKEKKFYIRDHYMGTYSEEDIHDFKRRYNVKGELRDTLKKYSELYPNNNIVITGHNCLKRGVTFNTDGFSFTHAFYTGEVDSSHIVEYIHLCSRSAGHVNYTRCHNVYITRELYECMDKYLDRMEKCIEGDVQMDETSMNDILPQPKKKAPRGTNAAAQYVPLVIRDTRVLGIPKSKSDKEEYVRKIILDFDPHYLDGHEKHEIVEPRTELSKKRNIYDLVKKFELNQKYSWGVKECNRFKNIWSVAIDRENGRIVVTKHTGKNLTSNQTV